MSSITFYGWDVEYDWDHLRPEQGAKAGNLYTMYHGTSVKSARDIIQNGFKQSRDGMLGPGVYVSRDQKKAERYPLNTPTDRVVLKLQVDCGKVKRIDTDNHPMQKTWHQNGYDTAWVPPHCGMKAVPSGLEEDCIFDPKRVNVIDVVLAPNSDLPQLKQLVNQCRGKTNSSSLGVCSLCTVAGQGHFLQSCWGCGQHICSFQSKHICNNWE